MDNKIAQCETFESIGVGLGVFAPTLVYGLDFVYNLKAYTHNLNISQGPYLILIPICSFLVSWAFVKFARTSYQKNKESHGDYSLYVGGIVMIILVGYLVYYTGGMDHSLFRDYFIFIPAAIAIVFKARVGLIIVLLACFLAVLLIYNSNPVPYYAASIKHNSFPHIIVYFIHFCAIYLLEQHNNVQVDKV